MTSRRVPATGTESLFERSPDGMLLVSALGEIECSNPAAQAILAARADVLEGSHVSRWAPDLEVTSGRHLSAVDAFLVSAHGDRFPAEVSAFPADAFGHGGRVWVLFRDLSIRKGLEGPIKAHATELEQTLANRTHELEDLHRRYRRLYDHVPVLDFELDSQHAVASANRKACVSLGVTNDRLTGLPLKELAVPDGREDLVKALVAMSEGSVVPFETRLRAADGAVIDVVLHGCRAEGANRSGLRVVGLDVTARREAEQLVDQSLDLAEAQRARMERILRGIGEGVVVTDSDGQVRLMNPIAESFLGIDERFAFGRDLLAEQRDADFSRHWSSFVWGEGDVATAELTINTPSRRVYTVTMSRIRTPEGRPAGCVAILHDVTRERLLDQMKTDFVSNLTHELRTPLASIRGFTATVLRGEDVGEGDRVRFLEIVEKEAERLQELIEDLLALSRLEAGRDLLSLRPFDFNDLLTATSETFRPAAEQRGLRLELAGDPANGYGVFDPEKVRRVLDNLVMNALKFTPAGGRVTIRFARSGDRLECEVHDTGRGMDRDTLERIFDRFYTKNPGGGNPQGTGLGLHIVQRIIELHGGKIEVESAPDQGSTFRFFIPAVPRAAAEAQARAAESASDPLVDDVDEDVVLGLSDGQGTRAT